MINTTDNYAYSLLLLLPCIFEMYTACKAFVFKQRPLQLFQIAVCWKKNTPQATIPSDFCVKVVTLPHKLNSTNA